MCGSHRAIGRRKDHGESLPCCNQKKLRNRKNGLSVGSRNDNLTGGIGNITSIQLKPNVAGTCTASRFIQLNAHINLLDTCIVDLNVASRQSKATRCVIRGVVSDGRGSIGCGNDLSCRTRERRQCFQTRGTCIQERPSEGRVVIKSILDGINLRRTACKGISHTAYNYIPCLEFNRSCHNLSLIGG